MASLDNDDLDRSVGSIAWLEAWYLTDLAYRALSGQVMIMYDGESQEIVEISQEES
jgi:hypothetical protein